MTFSPGSQNYSPRILLLLLLLPPYLFFFQSNPNYTNPNEQSRFLLTAALVDDHSFQIDNPLKRFGPCQDISYYKGHYYSNKAIGYSLLAVPFYYFAAHILHISDYDVLIYLLKLFVNLIPLLLFSALLLRFMENDSHLGELSYALLGVFLYGTLIFPYAQLFTSHMITGLIWFTALYLVVYREQKSAAFVAGALLGVSFLLEIPSVMIIPPFFIWIAMYRRPLLAHFTIGCILLCLPAFAYNILVFDGPLHWSYRYVSRPELKSVVQQGYVGLHAPSLGVLWQLMFGTNRGFFVYQPVLAFGVAGFVSAWKNRRESWLCVSIIVVSLLFYSGWGFWDGGWSFGPRFLVPLVPVFFYGCVMWFSEVKPGRLASSLFFAAFGWTFANMLMGSATFLLSPRFLTHLLEWEVPTLFWDGFFGFNWGDVFGLSDAWVRFVYILMTFIVVFALLWKSRLRTAPWMAALLASAAVLFGTGLLQPWIQAHTPAAHCVVIGRTGYIQGRYAKALSYLMLGRKRAADPNIRNEADTWIGLTKQKIESQP